MSDIVVIGSGPAGYVAAIHAAQCGASVTVVEKDPVLGGTCLHRGCIPTKALLESAHLFEKMKGSARFGIRAADVSVDFPKVQAYKNRVVKTNASGVQFLFKKNKIEVIRGWGELAGDGEVRIKGEDGATTTIRPKRGILLATGSACKYLPFIEMDHERTIDSDDILQLEQIPKSLVVLGAGAVGTEFASIFRRFGSEVHLVELLPRLLPLEDADISDALAKALQRQRIKVMTSTRVESVERDGETATVIATKDDGETYEIVAERVLVATGRRPLTTNVGLENTKAVVDSQGFVAVDEYMQTGEPAVYAIGDIVPTAMLAHLGSHEGILAVDHMLGHMLERNPRPINYDWIPSCTYCEPEVASVGLSEEEAKKRGLEVETATFPFTANGKARIMAETTGFIKLVGDAANQKILGAHIIGPKATELIAEAVVALNLNASAADLANSVHPHPTLNEAMGEVAHALHTGQALHF